MNCRFLMADRTCQVSTLLAKLPVLADEKACNACLHSDSPQAVNNVTCARAAEAMRRANIEIDPAVLTCVRASYAIGPGTALKKALSFWASVVNGCGCQEKIAMMNRWGVDECLKRIDEITDWIVQGAVHRWPWLRFAPKRWYIKLIVKRAIKSADRASIRH